VLADEVHPPRRGRDHPRRGAIGSLEQGDDLIEIRSGVGRMRGVAHGLHGDKIVSAARDVVRELGHRERKGGRTEGRRGGGDGRFSLPAAYPKVFTHLEAP